MVSKLIGIYAGLILINSALIWLRLHKRGYYKIRRQTSHKRPQTPAINYDLFAERERLEIQLDLLMELSEALDFVPVSEQKEAKHIKTRLANERAISTVLNKIARIDQKMSRP